MYFSFSVFILKLFSFSFKYLHYERESPHTWLVSIDQSMTKMNAIFTFRRRGGRALLHSIDLVLFNTISQFGLQLTQGHKVAERGVLLSLSRKAWIQSVYQPASSTFLCGVCMSSVCYYGTFVFVLLSTHSTHWNAICAKSLQLTNYWLGTESSPLNAFSGSRSQWQWKLNEWSN